MLMNYRRTCAILVWALLIDASASGLGAQSLSNSIAATAGTPQTAQTNTTFAIALQARVLDIYSNPVSGVSVTFTAPSSGASGTFTPGSTTSVASTNASGFATAPPFRANGTVGSYR